MSYLTVVKIGMFLAGAGYCYYALKRSKRIHNKEMQPYAEELNNRNNLCQHKI